MAGTVDQAHYNQTYGKEVVAIQFGSGATAMEAWFNETNMYGAPGHHNWILNSSITRVGFGYDVASQTFVGEAKQFLWVKGDCYGNSPFCFYNKVN